MSFLGELIASKKSAGPVASLVDLCFDVISTNMGNQKFTKSIGEQINNGREMHWITERDVPHFVYRILSGCSVDTLKDIEKQNAENGYVLDTQYVWRRLCKSDDLLADHFRGFPCENGNKITRREKRLRINSQDDEEEDTYDDDVLTDDDDNWPTPSQCNAKSWRGLYMQKQKEQRQAVEDVQRLLQQKKAQLVEKKNSQLFDDTTAGRFRSGPNRNRANQSMISQLKESAVTSREASKFSAHARTGGTVLTRPQSTPASSTYRGRAAGAGPVSQISKLMAKSKHENAGRMATSSNIARVPPQQRPAPVPTGSRPISAGRSRPVPTPTPVQRTTSATGAQKRTYSQQNPQSTSSPIKKLKTAAAAVQPMRNTTGAAASRGLPSASRVPMQRRAQ